MSNPFDFTDTSDLPEDMAKAVKRRPAGRVMDSGLAMQALAQADRPVTAGELWAACFRMFGKAPTQKSIYDMLARYTRTGRVVRTSHGYYALPAASKSEAA